MKTKQRWRCPICEHEYVSPIALNEVLCPKNHVPARGRSARGVMELIEGELPRKKVSSANAKR